MSKVSLLTIAILSFVAPLRVIADCSSTAVVQAPQTACKSGTATVAVIPIPGATYVWTVEGGTIVSGGATDKISIALGTSSTAAASVTATAGNCVAQGRAAIALHDPFAVHAVIPAAHASESLTITWSYDNGSPSQQTISGTDFGVLTLPLDARSYTYVPSASGSQQIVIDAAMQSAPAAPVSTARRRAVRATPATASTCATAHMSVQYDVSACVEPRVILDGPDSVIAGAEFRLSVDPQPGAVATWTIENGSPATATGNSVIVTAGSTGVVDFIVSLVRGLCVAQLDRRIAITAKPECKNPTAVVSAGPLACGSAIVNVSFTGTPPFRGMWSDGSVFNTNSKVLARTVTVPGNYSIASIEDAACTGTSSGVAVLPVLRPTATIVGKVNSCVGQDTVKVQFSGKPPFSGRWLDNSSFETNDMEIEKAITEEGFNTLSYGYDGTDCRMTVFGGVQGHPTQKVHISRFCWPGQFNNPVLLSADFDSYFTAPLTVNWSDGVTTTDIGNPPYRFIDLQQTTTYSIVSAHDAYCSAVFDGPQSVTVYVSPVPDFILGVGDICVSETKTTSLATPPPADATVHWFIEGDGSIVSGQGTSSIQYKPGAVGTLNVGCTFTFPDDRCPTSGKRAVRVDSDPVGTIALDKPRIHAGETVLITYSVDVAAANWYLEDSLQDSIERQGNCGAHTMCQALYTSSHGPGTSTINLQMVGFCDNTKTVSVPLTIVP